MGLFGNKKNQKNDSNPNITRLDSMEFDLDSNEMEYENQNESATGENYTLDKGTTTVKKFISRKGLIFYKDYIQAGYNRFMRCFYPSSYPKRVGFADWLYDAYTFGDVDISILIRPVEKTRVIRELNVKLTQFVSDYRRERQRDNIDKADMLEIASDETRELRNRVEFNIDKMFWASFIACVGAKSKKELDEKSESFIYKMSAENVNFVDAFFRQKDTFKSIFPFVRNDINKFRNFNLDALSSVFPFVNPELNHEGGIPIGINRITGNPIFFNNWDKSLSNPHMTIWAESGAGKTYMTYLIIARGIALLDIWTIAIDVEGVYNYLANMVGGTSVIFSKDSKNRMNFWDIKTEYNKRLGKNEINVTSKYNDVKRILIVMLKGQSNNINDEVTSLEMSLLEELIEEEYNDLEISNEPSSLYFKAESELSVFVRKVENEYKKYQIPIDIKSMYFDKIGGDYKDIRLHEFDINGIKKPMPTMTSFYNRILLKKAKLAESNEDFKEKLLIVNKFAEVFKVYTRERSMGFFDGQSTVDLENAPFVNLDISELDEEFEQPLTMVILVNWVWEHYVKRNTEGKRKRVIIDEAWMLLKMGDVAVNFLNVMSRRARKRKVSLTTISQRFEDFYNDEVAKGVISNASIQIFLKQNSTEVGLLKEVYNLTDLECSFLTQVNIGNGIIRMNDVSTTMHVVTTDAEREFLDPDVKKYRKS